MQHRVVGIGGDGERRHAGHQHRPAHPLPGRDNRPFALPLPQRQKMLRRFALMRVEIEALAEHVLRRFILPRAFHDAGDLVQRRDLVGDGRALHRCEPAQRLIPLLHGAGRLPRPLPKPAEIDMGGHEIGVERDRPLQRRRGPLHIPRIGKQDRLIEENGVQQWIALMARHPIGIERPRARPVAALQPRLDRFDEAQHAQTAGFGAIHAHQTYPFWSLAPSGACSMGKPPTADHQLVKAS